MTDDPLHKRSPIVIIWLEISTRGAASGAIRGKGERLLLSSQRKARENPRPANLPQWRHARRRCRPQRPQQARLAFGLQSVNLPPVSSIVRRRCAITAVAFHAPRKLGIRGKKDTHLRTVIAGLLTARTDSAPQRLNLRHRRRCAWLTSSDVFWPSLQGAHLS
jgi:hypothetical protein